MTRWILLASALVGCEAGTGTNPGTTPTGTPTGTSSLTLADVMDMVVSPEVQVESCSDMLVGLADPADTMLVTLAVLPDLAEQARVAGKPVTFSTTLPSKDVELRARWGEHLRQWYACDDVIEHHPVVDGETSAIAGTVDITVVSEKSASKHMPYAKATFELTDVRFEDDEGVQEDMSDLQLVDLFVGWYPG